MSNEDETIEKLRMIRKRRAIKKMIAMLISAVILTIITPILLVIISIILMLAGVSAMYNIGFLTRKEEKKEDVDIAFERSFYEGVFLSLLGLGVFIIALYIMSIGWYGILKL